MGMPISRFWIRSAQFFLSIVWKYRDLPWVRVPATFLYLRYRKGRRLTISCSRRQTLPGSIDKGRRRREEFLSASSVVLLPS